MAAVLCCRHRRGRCESSHFWRPQGGILSPVAGDASANGRAAASRVLAGENGDWPRSPGGLETGIHGFLWAVQLLVVVLSVEEPVPIERLEPNATLYYLRSRTRRAVCPPCGPWVDGSHNKCAGR